MIDCIQRMAENQYLEPEPPRCPVCGSIDISAAGVCLHCGSKTEQEDTYEKCEDDPE